MFISRDEFMRKVERLIPTLSKSQRLVAGYLMSDRNGFVFKTAKELGSSIGVSESTVVRFARMAGFETYSDMQRFMQREYMRHVETPEACGEFCGEQGNILESTVKRDISNLQKLLRPHFYEDFIKAAQMIVDAKRVYIAGSRGAASIAENFFYNINYMKPDVFPLAKDSGDWQNLMIDCREDALLVAITMPKYSKRTCEMIAFAKEAGARVLSVTDSKISPAAALADCVLGCEIGPQYFIWSSAVVMSVLNALLIQVMQMDGDAGKKRMESMREMTQKNAPRIYEWA